MYNKVHDWTFIIQFIKNLIFFHKHRMEKYIPSTYPLTIELKIIKKY